MFERTRYEVDQIDTEIYAVIQQENRRQKYHNELITSENHTSPAVMTAHGSQLTNKYAEHVLGKANVTVNKSAISQRSRKTLRYLRHPSRYANNDHT